MCFKLKKKLTQKRMSDISLEGAKIDEIFIGLVLFSLPINISFNSFIVTAISAFFLYKSITQTTFKSLIIYTPSFVFFGVQLFSYIISDNKQEAGIKLLLFSSFVLFPICFSYLTHKKIKLNQNNVFKFLLYGTLIILLYGFIRFFYDIIFLNVRYDYGRAVALILKYIPHHVYMSMFILISIFIILNDSIENSKIKKSLYLVPFLYLLLILLSSRMAILLGIVILPLFLFRKLKHKNNQKKMMIYGGLLMFLVIMIGFSNNFVRDKILYTYYDLLNIATKEKPFFGISFRQQIWSSALDLIYQSPLLGYGIGDIQEILNNTYNKKEIMGLNAHSQYLQFILHHGIVVFLILIVIIFKLIKQCFNNKNVVLLFSWIIILSFCLTESILNRQWGVNLFALILNYSIYSQSKFLKVDK